MNDDEWERCSPAELCAGDEFRFVATYGDYSTCHYERRKRPAFTPEPDTLYRIKDGRVGHLRPCQHAKDCLLFSTHDGEDEHCRSYAIAALHPEPMVLVRRARLEPVGAFHAPLDLNDRERMIWVEGYNTALRALREEPGR